MPKTHEVLELISALQRGRGKGRKLGRKEKERKERPGSSGSGGGRPEEGAQLRRQGLGRQL